MMLPVSSRHFFKNPFSEKSGGFTVQKKNETEGPTVPRGSYVTVHYTGMFPDGKVFDSSVSRGEPL
jgi:peptidylprolyl isomerase